jgi:hypothetical protein
MGIFNQQFDHDEASIVIDAPPEAVYAVISDVTRTPEYSPEVISCAWIDGAEGPRVGARFEARNKVAGALPGRTGRSSRSRSQAGSSHSPGPRSSPAPLRGATCSPPRVRAPGWWSRTTSPLP